VILLSVPGRALRHYQLASTSLTNLIYTYRWPTRHPPPARPPARPLNARPAGRTHRQQGQLPPPLPVTAAPGLYTGCPVPPAYPSPRAPYIHRRPTRQLAPWGNPTSPQPAPPRHPATGSYCAALPPGLPATAPRAPSGPPAYPSPSIHKATGNCPLRSPPPAYPSPAPPQMSRPRPPRSDLGRCPRQLPPALPVTRSPPDVLTEATQK
jgi:hypothetical protein